MRRRVFRLDRFLVWTTGDSETEENHFFAKKLSKVDPDWKQTKPFHNCTLQLSYKLKELLSVTHDAS